MVSDFYVFEGRKVKRLMLGKWSIFDFILLDDGIFIFKVNMCECGILMNIYIYYYNLEIGEMRKLMKDFDRVVYNFFNSDVRGV